MSEATEKKEELQQENERLRKQIEDLREELEETTRGTLALYNEIENKNADLRKHQEQLEQKNRELQKALEDLKTSEEARIRSARTAAIGNIVVTYNHEINNPLAVIFGSLDMFKLKKNMSKKEIEHELDKVGRAADRIRDVIMKIKQYENLLPKSYINWDMLDLESARSKAEPSDD